MKNPTEKQLLSAIAAAAEMADAAFKRLINPEGCWNAPTNNKGQWPFIPLSNHYFVNGLLGAMGLYEGHFGRRPATFLEVGCGFGVKASVADGLGLRATGIEYHKPYLDIARRLPNNASLIEADALTYDYAPFDLIYFYMPLQCPKMAAEFVQRLIDKASGVVFGSTVGLEGTAWAKPRVDTGYPSMFAYIAPTKQFLRLPAH